MLYEGKPLDKYFVADFVCFEGILVEIKAVTAMPLNFIRQVLHYLKATGYRIGLLINFGASGLQWKRVIV